MTDNTFLIYGIIATVLMLVGLSLTIWEFTRGAPNDQK
jgi:hypothetical protein